jgi:hypothetical protein
VGADHKGPLAAFAVVAIIAGVLLVTSVRSQAAPSWFNPNRLPAAVVVGAAGLVHQHAARPEAAPTPAGGRVTSGATHAARGTGETGTGQTGTREAGTRHAGTRHESTGDTDASGALPVAVHTTGSPSSPPHHWGHRAAHHWGHWTRGSHLPQLPVLPHLPASLHQHGKHDATPGRQAHDGDPAWHGDWRAAWPAHWHPGGHRGWRADRRAGWRADWHGAWWHRARTAH